MIKAENVFLKPIEKDLDRIFKVCQEKVWFSVHWTFKRMEMEFTPTLTQIAIGERIFEIGDLNPASFI